ncbi:hypothetical protein RCL1_004354 [Eukaryota sp. TZLM3-RCL]
MTNNYWPVTNTGLSLGIFIVLGFILGKTKKIEPKLLVGLNQYVFFIGLPGAVLNQIWSRDMYNIETEVWSFINCWITFRLCMLALSVCYGIIRKQHIGDICSNWLATTWASTILLGQPFIESLYGPKLGRQPWGVWAGVSSWIAQLPWMLTMFEFYKIQRDSSEEYSAELAKKKEAEEEQKKLLETETTESEETPEDVQVETEEVIETVVAEVKPVITVEAELCLVNGMLPWKAALKRVNFVKIVLKILTNPVLIAVILGWTLTLFKVGIPGWTPPPPPGGISDRTNPLFFIYQFLTTAGPTASPLAMTAVGLFAASSGNGLKGLIPCGVRKLLVYLFIKMIITPIIMIPLASLFGLEGAIARAAVIVCATPISNAAFALSKQYNHGAGLMAPMIVVGAITLLPVVLFLDVFMNWIGVFPLE